MLPEVPLPEAPVPLVAPGAGVFDGTEVEVPVPPTMPASLPVPEPVAPVAFWAGMELEDEAPEAPLLMPVEPPLLMPLDELPVVEPPLLMPLEEVPVVESPPLMPLAEVPLPELPLLMPPEVPVAEPLGIEPGAGVFEGTEVEVPVPPTMPASLPVVAPLAPVAFCAGIELDGTVVDCA
ncbi:hypothetical protein NCCP691_17360 [Noviherbaspirillum aridicola]|uniref:Uncharacterized protein n=1 Tax=Noviherbaspirillum aridicola TaxID=2849687 RepID=A0ABQ4Q3U7_9BURK|nr:hypothetical protein NCCP691_17360 [Noviherbaspirillum aridicola]